MKGSNHGWPQRGRAQPKSQAGAALTEKLGPSDTYLPFSREQIALEVQEGQRVRSGSVPVLSCVEAWRIWFDRGNCATKKLELKLQWS